jgi:hypothetical protein
LPALDIKPPENPLDQYAKALSVKSMIQGQQTQQLQQTALSQENQMRQIALTDASGQKRALIDANGDMDKFRQNVRDPKYGVSVQGQLDMDNKIMAHEKSAYELDDTGIANAQKKATAIAGHLQPLTELPDWDAVQKELPKTINAALADGTATQQEVKNLQNITNMDDLKMHVSGLQVIGDQIKQAQDNRQKGIESWKPDGNGNMVNVDKTDPKFGTVLPISNALPVPPDLAAQLNVPEMGGKPVTPKQLKEMKDALDAGHHFENYGGEIHLVDSSGKELKTMGTAPAQVTFVQGQNALQGGALDQAAERYWQTGVMPMGMRSPGISSAILNRSAELHPEGNIAANSAAFKANQASYENVTKTLDTLSAFENTGLKNLKQFTDLAAKIPDVGVPWLNTPIRTLDEKAVGSANMAAVQAARAVALREIARVTNDPKLSGQLSDHAREEVEGLVPANATFNQIKAVANVLQSDMANVHSSLAAQKDDIGRRLGLPQHQNAAAPPPSSAVVPDNVTKALANVSSGRHTLSDGTVWDKRDDGSMSQVITNAK